MALTNIIFISLTSLENKTPMHPKNEKKVENVKTA